MSKKYPLTLSADTFNGFKTDFDQTLRKLLSDMERLDSDEATIGIKIAVTLEKGKERDFEATGIDAMKDITKPTFKHDISTTIQVKNKIGGSLGGNMKMVWDRDLCQYVMQEIDNGQQSLFNDGGTVVNDVPYTVIDDDAPDSQQSIQGGTHHALPPFEDAVDADYTDVEDGGGAADDTDAGGSEDESGGDPAVTETAYEFLSKYVGNAMRVMESMGIYTVRSEDNTVILSSALPVTNRMYCSPEKLKPHIGHSLVCVMHNEDQHQNISIECQVCGDVLFIIESDEHSTPDDYQYQDPEE